MTSVTADQLFGAFKRPENKQEAICLLLAFPDKFEIKNIKDSGSYYLIHHAAGNGWTDIVELLVTTYHCNPNCSNRWGDTSLHPNCTAYYGETSLHWACANNQLHTVKLLTTQYCLNPLKANSGGFTPLIYSSGETKQFLQQIIGKCVCLYASCLYICTLLKYPKQRIIIYLQC